MWGLFKKDKVEGSIGNIIISDIAEPRFGFDDVEWIKPNHTDPKYKMSVTAKGIVMHKDIAEMLHIGHGHYIEVGFVGDQIILKVNRDSHVGFRVRPERIGSDKLEISSQFIASSFLERDIERGQYGITSITPSRFALQKVEVSQ